jgi:hypothetical protein
MLAMDEKRLRWCGMDMRPRWSRRVGVVVTLGVYFVATFWAVNLRAHHAGFWVMLGVQVWLLMFSVDRRLSFCGRSRIRGRMGSCGWLRGRTGGGCCDWMDTGALGFDVGVGFAADHADVDGAGCSGGVAWGGDGGLAMAAGKLG